MSLLVKFLSRLNKKSLDLYDLLTIFTFLQALLFVFFIFSYEWNKFCSLQSLILGLVLLFQALFISRLYKTFKRPFILYFCFYLEIFYTLRILTLYIFNHSNVLERFPYFVTHTNFALIFIISANFFLFLGYFLNLRRTKNYEIKKNKNQRFYLSTIKLESLINLICILLFTSIVIQLSGLLSFFYLNAPRYLSTLSIFITPNLFYITFFTILVFFFNRVTSTQKIFLLLLLTVYFTLLTLGGSRSAIYGALEILFISILCFQVIDKKYLPKIKLSFLLFVTPLLLLSLFFTFKIGTASRDLGPSFTLISALDYLNFNSAEFVLKSIFSRIGFFDFSSEIIAHEKYYSSIFNFKSYFNSLVDNILTPGFDLFDQPKIGSSLSFIYNSLGELSKKTSSLPQFYQSDQIGIYGELYLLFGFFSLIIFFTLGFFIGFFEDFILKTKGMICVQIYTLFIFLLSRLFNSFGLDWFLLDCISYLAIFSLLIFIQIKFYKINIS
jgi:hypothetical protein